MSVEITREIDARGSFCPGPMMELIRVIKSSQVGEVVAVLSTDKGSQRDIPKWVEKAKHELVGVETIDNYDKIIVKKLH
ncbi:sulfurtransferase TusA family protein [Alicyclobacillus sp. SO9]|uniref:sulfurtransferase TusA family protein n=1 Tax=Alicyclobacillus sp. SO9 TaxID=2665646 RepID=UPI0018E78809|nr:sulfurtransferase TusA family protein [Alicyclobacillus sp. SO9]QQE81004.1 sulfurtransferase TusA family protein [Alicyclobacillus sp. SO9]